MYGIRMIETTAYLTDVDGNEYTIEEHNRFVDEVAASTRMNPLPPRRPSLAELKEKAR